MSSKKILIEDDQVWSHGVTQTVPTDSRFTVGNESGVTAPPPAHTDHNYLMNRACINEQAILREGITEYDPNEDYEPHALYKVNGAIHQTQLGGVNAVSTAIIPVTKGKATQADLNGGVDDKWVDANGLLNSRGNFRGEVPMSPTVANWADQIYNGTWKLLDYAANRGEFPAVSGEAAWLESTVIGSGSTCYGTQTIRGFYTASKFTRICFEGWWQDWRQVGTGKATANNIRDGVSNVWVDANGLRNNTADNIGDMSSTRSGSSRRVGMLESKGYNSGMAGVIFDFGGPVPPAGSLSCNGQEVSKATYPKLYAAIGDSWATCAGLPPPAEGMFRVPMQSVGGLGLYNRGVGSTSGPVGTYGADTLKSHAHNASHSHSGHTTSFYANKYRTRAYAGGAVERNVVSGWGDWTFTGENGSNTEHSMSLSGSNGIVVDAKAMNTSATGNPAETRPRSVTVLQCVWY